MKMMLQVSYTLKILAFRQQHCSWGDWWSRWLFFWHWGCSLVNWNYRVTSKDIWGFCTAREWMAWSSRWCRHSPPPPCENETINCLKQSKISFLQKTLSDYMLCPLFVHMMKIMLFILNTSVHTTQNTYHIVPSKRPWMLAAQVPGGWLHREGA